MYLEDGILDQLGVGNGVSSIWSVLAEWRPEFTGLGSHSSSPAQQSYRQTLAYCTLQRRKIRITAHNGFTHFSTNRRVEVVHIYQKHHFSLLMWIQKYGLKK